MSTVYSLKSTNIANEQIWDAAAALAPLSCGPDVMQGNRHRKSMQLWWRRYPCRMYSSQHCGNAWFWFQARSQNCEKRPLTSACLSYLSFHPSACPHGTNRLPLDGFTLNLVFVYFVNICRVNSSFIKIWQEWRVLYMTTNIHFWSYFAQLFLEWENFQTKKLYRKSKHTF